MYKILFLLGIIFLCPAKLLESSVNKSENRNRQELEKQIQGEWESIWSNVNSDKIDKVEYYKFDGKKVFITYKKGEEPFEAEFRLIPSSESGKGGIDLINPSIDYLSKGLYVLRNDTLVLFIPYSGLPRPKSIHATLKVDENIRFLVLIRKLSKKE